MHCTHGSVDPVCVLFANGVDGLGFGRFGKFGQATVEVFWRFIPHANAKRLGLGLALDGAGGRAAHIVLVKEPDTRGDLFVARWRQVVDIGSEARPRKIQETRQGQTPLYGAKKSFFLCVKIHFLCRVHTVCGHLTLPECPSARTCLDGSSEKTS